jgi:hypothetical protein
MSLQVVPRCCHAAPRMAPSSDGLYTGGKRGRKRKRQGPRHFMRRAFYGALMASLLNTSGCVGPPALHDSVLGYDETVASLEQEILLLNMARLSTDQPPHFTVTSSIAATFNFETSSGISGSIFEGAGTDVLSLSVQSRAAENPTFSIVPISGQEFTNRILTPINEGVLAFFAFQGVRIELLARLMADGIELLSPEGITKAFFFNKVTTPDQFRMYCTTVMRQAAASFMRPSR